MSRLGSQRRRPASPERVGGLQVVIFKVGDHCFAVPREQVKAIRESPRVRSRLETGSIAATSLPLVSLSTVLDLDRDTSVDRRVLEVEHWGQRLGLEVTTIEGIRDLGSSVLHPLPPIARRNLESKNVLGLLEWIPSDTETGRKGADEVLGEATSGPETPYLALDLVGLLVEQGVDVPGGDSPSPLEGVRKTT